MKRCLECKQLNEDGVPECERCGGSSLAQAERETGPISVESSAIEPVQCEGVSPVIECQDQPEFTFSVRDGDDIGRGAKIDVTCLNRSNYISRPHARFSLQDGQWFIVHLSRENPTLVNSVALSFNKKVPVYDGDQVTLADTSFTFRLRGARGADSPDSTLNEKVDC